MITGPAGSEAAARLAAVDSGAYTYAALDHIAGTSRRACHDVLRQHGFTPLPTTIVHSGTGRSRYRSAVAAATERTGADDHRLEPLGPRPRTTRVVCPHRTREATRHSRA